MKFILRNTFFLALCCFGILAFSSCFPKKANAVSWKEMKQAWPKLWFNSKPCRVLRVVDGDTLKVQCGSKKETLRLMGIDTPETKHPFKPIEYYGPEASAQAKKLLTVGSDVWLAFQKRPSNGNLPRGRYGRVLAYLFMKNGDMFNAQMIRNGFAFAMRRYSNIYKQKFIAIEATAIRTRKGMWSDPQKVQAMKDADKAYRNLKRECVRKMGFPKRFKWIIGDSQHKVYHTRSSRRYFRTNPRTRVLFCSIPEAREKGYRGINEAAASGQGARQQPSTPSPTIRARTPKGALILANPQKKTFKVIQAYKYRIFNSVQEARAAGYNQVGKRRKSNKKGRQTTAYSKTAPNCKGKIPVVGNKRSKVYRTSTQRSYKRSLKSRNAVFFCTEKQAVTAGFRRAKR